MRRRVFIAFAACASQAAERKSGRGMLPASFLFTKLGVEVVGACWDIRQEIANGFPALFLFSSLRFCKLVYVFHCSVSLAAARLFAQGGCFGRLRNCGVKGGFFIGVWLGVVGVFAGGGFF